MKPLKFFLLGTLALLFVCACDDDENSLSDADYAGQASISSQDSAFTSTTAGGTVKFTAEGKEVVVTVDCGTEWTATNTGSDWLEAAVDVQAGTLTLTAGQNTVEEEKTATVTLKTAKDGVEFATITATQTAYNTPDITVGATEWHAPAVGALSTEISVEFYNGDLTTETDAAWLTVEATDSGVSLTAAENTDTAERTAEVVLTCSDGVKSATETVTVVQDGKAYITLAQETVEIDAAGGTETLTVESNFDWEVSFEADWLTIDGANATLTVTATANKSIHDHEAVVTITAGDGAENVTETTFTVSQVGHEPEPLILTLTTEDANATVKLPFKTTDDLNCSVDWGDGSEVVTVTSAYPTHTYTEAGVYNVTIDGTVSSLYSYELSTAEASYITGVKQWGDTGLTSMDNAFNACSNLASLPEETGEAFAEVTTFHWAFRQCKALTSLPADLFADCPKATSFDTAFYQCTSLEELPEGLFSNCLEVTTFSNVFQGCSALTKVPDNLFANSKATTFANAFTSCSAITEVSETAFAGCTEVESFSGTFQACSLLTSIPAKLFAACAKVTTFNMTFYNSSGITSIPEGLFDNCTSAENFTSTFYGTSITTVPENLFKNCTEVNTIGNTFYNCKSLVTVPAGLFSSWTKVTKAEGLFYNCTALESVPEGLFAAFTGSTSYANLFRGCTNLKSVPGDLFSYSPSATTFSYVFYGCTALTELPPELFDNNMAATTFAYCFNGCTGLVCESPYTVVEKDGETVNVHLYQRTSYTSELGCPSSITGSKCFTSCTNLLDYSSISSSWR